MERWNPSLAGRSAMSYDPKAFARMKADTINNTPGSLTGFDCPKCRNRGHVAVPKEDGGIFFRECGCMAIRRCVWEMEKSGLQNTIREKTFEAFLDREPWQKAIKAGVQAYSKSPTGWLLLCGQSGSGKTHLCTAVCRERLLAGDPVRFMPWREKISQLKALSFDSEERDKLLRDFKEAPILYIDDLYKTGKAPDGSASPTGADVALAFEILNHRYNNHLPTILSTEKSPQELVDIDEATGSRVIEAARKHIYAIEKNPKRNYRLRGISPA